MMEPSRVAMDTTILVSAILMPASIPRQAFTTAIRSYELCVSDAALTELREVLQRPKFDRYLPLQDRLRFLDLVEERCRMWEVDEASARAAEGVCRDPKDENFLSLALSCQAWALVTSDKDLLILDPWRGVRIVTPAAFLQAHDLECWLP